MMTEVVLISGKMGSGKTTAANRLQDHIDTFHGDAGWKVFQIPFATAIYEMHDACRAILDKYGVDKRHETKDGDLLQLLGTEWGRKTLGQDVWVRATEGIVKNLVSATLASYPRTRRITFLIPDCRFKNELAHSFPSMRKVSVRLECPREIRKERCLMWRERENHPSEIDLDDCLGLFDMIFHTGSASADEVAAHIYERLLRYAPTA